MVVGIDKFREFFESHEGKYAIIGGAACDLLFSEAGLGFRATKDIDMVLCVEVVDPAFGAAFKDFLDAGGYQARERSSGKREFYRFHRPTGKGFPAMIEIFSRGPDIAGISQDARLKPIPVEDEALSLSAILLDEGYYATMQAAKREIEGVTVVDETFLILLKMHAYFNLTAYKEAGNKVSGREIKKHRNDVLRLAQLLREDAVVTLPVAIYSDLSRFIDLIQSDASIDPHVIGVRLSRDEIIALLRSVYRPA